MMLSTYGCKQPNSTTDDDELLAAAVPIIEKFCKFWSTILAGTWCSPGEKWYSTFDTTGSVPLSKTYWLSVAQGWDEQLTVLVELSGNTYNISEAADVQLWEWSLKLVLQQTSSISN